MARGASYRIHRKIADGGMAEIFLASQLGAEGFEKQVVLKRILPALAADAQFVRMFLDEAHIASTLNHSNIVQVLDLGRARDRYFLVLEFVDGWNLDVIRRRGIDAQRPLPMGLCLWIMGAVCRGLHYAHSRRHKGKALGIVHRDVSPHNVLISREGEVKLSDFGIAKAADRRERSVAGIIKGKVGFMSPEQSLGEEVDARSDVFSAGTLLYLITVGRHPFDAPTDVEVIHNIREVELDPPSKVIPGFDPRVEAIIHQALQVDREDRFESAEAMAAAVAEALDALPERGDPIVMKRYLEELQTLDKQISPGDSMHVEVAPMETIEPGGDDIELEALTPLWAANTVAATPAPMNVPGRITEKSAVPAAVSPPPGQLTDTTAAAPRPKGASPVLIGALLLALGAAGAWLAINWDGGTPSGQGQPGASSSASVATAATTAAAPVSSATTGTGGALTLIPGTADTAIAVPLADAGSVSAAADAAVGDRRDGGWVFSESDVEEDEEALIARIIPDLAARIVGEDEADEGDGEGATLDAGASPAGAVPTTSDAATTAKKVDAVRVAIRSTPKGAIVRSKRTVFGRTPITLKFRPGNRYKLYLIKSGYFRAERSFMARPVPTQRLYVTLKKAPPPKKGKSKGKKKKGKR